MAAFIFSPEHGFVAIPPPDIFQEALPKPLNSMPGIALPGGKYFRDGKIHDSLSTSSVDSVNTEEDWDSVSFFDLKDDEILSRLSAVIGSDSSDRHKVASIIDFCLEHLRTYNYLDFIEQCQTQQAP